MATFLRISEATSLAFHSVVYLASNPDYRVSVKMLAKHFRSSENHLAKVIQRLSKAGILQCVRGPGGGCKLAKPANETTLAEVYEAIDGPIHEMGCLFNEQLCDSCVFGGLIGDIERNVTKYFRTTTIADLAERGFDPAFPVPGDKPAFSNKDQEAVSV